MSPQRGAGRCLQSCAEPGRRRSTLDTAREIERRGFAGISESSSVGNIARRRPRIGNAGLTGQGLRPACAETLNRLAEDRARALPDHEVDAEIPKYKTQNLVQI